MRPLTICALGLMISSLASAQIKPSTVQRSITYQGVLTDGAGSPVTDNYYLITFRLYDAATSGTELWSEAQTLPTIKGQFNAILGTTTPLQLSFDKQYWLGVTVASGPEMVPRTALTPTPYSFRAFNADTAGTVNGFAASATPAPRKLLALDSTGKFPASAIPGGGGGGSGSPIYVTSAGAYAIRGENTASGDGVQGSSKDGIGILGTSQNNLGMKATTQNGVTAFEAINTKTNGNAISAEANNGTSSIAVDATSNNGYAIQATSSAGTGVVAEGSNFGVYGTSTGGIGVYGEGMGPGSYGVKGEGGETGVQGVGSSVGVRGAGGESGIGVFGTSTLNCAVVGSSQRAGVFGYVKTSTGNWNPLVGTGVGGWSDVKGGYGVYGRCDSSLSSAVEGYSLNGYGVKGNSSNSVGVYAISNYGTALYASGAASHTAALFDGSVSIVGTLTKTAGSFRIDHPLDPANKYLQHSFVESPDMKNMYDGIVTLDANGEATVRLPDYFEALNTEFRYQLTCIGGYAPVYVASKISGNFFRIAGGKPGLEVSWMVTGSRQDAYAKAHPIVTELPKSGAAAGKYLNPVEHGAPETMSESYWEFKRGLEFGTIGKGPVLPILPTQEALQRGQPKERPKIIRRGQPQPNPVQTIPQEVKEK